MLHNIKIWLDTHMRPSWRVWWKLWSMRLGVVFAAAVTYLTAFPQAFADAVSMFPPWLRDSLPVWVGPMTLGLLFVTRFWNQTHPKPAPIVAPEPVQERHDFHGAE